MVSLGVGGVAAGIMQLLAHGFFKGFCFSASARSFTAAWRTGFRKMGGLREAMPGTL